MRRNHRTKDLHPSKQKWEVVYEDPTKNFKRRTKGGFKTKQAAQDWADEWYVAQHFDRANTTKSYHRTIVAMSEPYDMFTRLVAFTGLRPEEATALRVCEVDTVELDPATLAHLTAYMKDHNKRAATWFSDHPDHGHPGLDLPLFVGAGDFSKFMSYSEFNRKHWAKAAKAAELPR